MEIVTCLVRRKYTRLQGILPIQLVTARKNDDLAPVDKIAIIFVPLILYQSIVPLHQSIWTLSGYINTPSGAMEKK